MELKPTCKRQCFQVLANLSSWYPTCFWRSPPAFQSGIGSGACPLLCLCLQSTSCPCFLQQWCLSLDWKKKKKEIELSHSLRNFLMTTYLSSWNHSTTRSSAAECNLSMIKAKIRFRCLLCPELRGNNYHVASCVNSLVLTKEQFEI